ncbi:hypothetical protein [Tautonia rosea]|uniref:hypothetical protein n=1 Tax=Tautonia rosea TaxID=2728037 RepID=UPI0014748EEE|nr:hypothetical protein [Tautonia rosea]
MLDPAVHAFVKFADARRRHDAAKGRRLPGVIRRLGWLVRGTAQTADRPGGRRP